ncbi:alkaline phosphatase family protein [Leucobacter sp. VD1]|uniref:alkaline phosphatase family protein n=1 Tax=Leucobacter sp. VD1 TaxID=3080381 RepID=UPI003015B1FB
MSNDEQQEPSPRGTSRRSILRGGGLLAAGAAAGFGGAALMRGLDGQNQAGQPYIPEEFAAPKPRTAPGFDHLVVLMGENRSFDNLLGHLYTPDTLPAGASFEGLAFGDYSNQASDGTVVPAHIYVGPTDRIMRQPDPDPGEEYPHVNTQLFGSLDDHNRGKDVADMSAPYNAPQHGARATMAGFVLDYETDFEGRTGRKPSPAERDQIMGSFSPEMLPVTSTLAREFGVYDHWFCAVPSQTFCNRSFFHASTSHGFVTNALNGGYDKWLNAAPTPTVFNRLEEAGLSWRIYFDKLQLISFTGMIHAPVLQRFWKTDRFATMEQFEADAKNGDLPEYAFVEPRMIFNHNDFHPPVGAVREAVIDGEDVYNGALSDVRAGDALVHRVYTAIRTAMSATGSNYLNTAMLLTFDEHGGTYDHVVPPAAKPPEPGAGEMGFTFDRLGCRVPAVLVSAYVERGSVFTGTMHHGSLAATLSDRFGLEPLTDRDHGAPSIAPSFNRQVPRHVADWPQPSPAFVPPNPEGGPHPAEAEPDRPLSPPAKGLLGLLISRYGEESERVNPPRTFSEAYALLQKYGQGLFGPGG